METYSVAGEGQDCADKAVACAEDWVGEPAVDGLDCLDGKREKICAFPARPQFGHVLGGGVEDLAEARGVHHGRVETYPAEGSEHGARVAVDCTASISAVC